MRTRFARVAGKYLQEQGCCYESSVSHYISMPTVKSGPNRLVMLKLFMTFIVAFVNRPKLARVCRQNLYTASSSLQKSSSRDIPHQAR